MTAVDILWDMIPKDTQNYIVKQFNGLEKAKEMEKEHELNLIKFTKEIFELGKSHFSYAIITNEEILELYNETYGGNK
jgi:hypothetical protein